MYYNKPNKNKYHKIIELINKNNKRIKLIKKEIKYLPSSLTTSGILSPKFCDAAIIPFAIVIQFTIPPKTLTRITLTFGSDKKKLVYILCLYLNNLCITYLH